ncbi:MAG: hypothetical protein EBY30_12360 [Rhodospirillales bacterium]|nr:hypothetical protein [Rhodospirillales bacterium]
MVEIRLGGRAASQVIIERSQFGLITTGEGDDVVELRSQHPWVLPRGRVFELRTGGGDDSITGWSSGHPLAGMRVEAGPGRDIVVGSSGPDEIAGGPGDDVMTGGAGRDRFILRRGEPGADVITDFELGADRLVLEGLAPRDVVLRDTAEGVVLTLAPDQRLTLRGVGLQGRAREGFLALLLGG